MEFIADPDITTKIQEMHKRVGWNSPELLKQGIDRTHFILEDNYGEREDFSFLAIGDSGSGEYGGYDPQYAIAEQMHQQQRARFRQSRLLRFAPAVRLIYGSNPRTAPKLSLN
jgi:hypothetical protein